jgi:hypothetical protein
VRKSASKRACDLHRLAVWAANLLIALSLLAIKTYYTTMETASAVQDIKADMNAQRGDMAHLLRNDAMQDQRQIDGKEDRDRLRARVQRLEDKLGKS